jgi:putative flippase GtrA
MGPAALVRRWSRFNAVGAVGVGVQLSILALLVRTVHVPPLVATGLAVEATVLHNFCWHQRWTWSDRPAGSPGASLRRFLQFQTLNGAISLAGNLAIVSLLTVLAHVGPMAANAVAILVCSLLNFAVSDTLVFTGALRSDAPAVQQHSLPTRPVGGASRHDASVCDIMPVAHGGSHARCDGVIRSGDAGGGALGPGAGACAGA